MTTVNLKKVKVVSGDTLSEISDRIHVPVQTLVDNNNISDPNKLSVGTYLIYDDTDINYLSDTDFDKYIKQSSNSLKCIKVPTGIELEQVYAVIAAEGGIINEQEARAIADVLINRSRDGNYGGTTIYDNAFADNQFEVTWNGAMYNYLNGNKSINIPANIKVAINDEFNKAAKGLATSYPYKSFRGNQVISYSNILVNKNGNRFSLK
jgi:murein DD-endopeptidase MepM/ murein hydrolase activator NlpD